MNLINQFFRGRERERERKTDYTKRESSLEVPLVADDGGEEGGEEGEDDRDRGSRSYTYRPNGGEGVRPTSRTIHRAYAANGVEDRNAFGEDRPNPR